jgi:hypothetical protein
MEVNLSYYLLNITSRIISLNKDCADENVKQDLKGKRTKKWIKLINP